MSLKTIVKKLEISEEKFITREEIKKTCKKLNLDYYRVIRYLIHNKYLVRILRGIFYIKSIEERKLNKIDINHLEAIREALRIKGISNWYFSLETALKLNNLTHEYFNITHVISDKIFRKNPFEIMGHKVKFTKIKTELTSFGIINEKIPYSDTEKTMLDFIYLKVRGNIKKIPVEIFEKCSRKRLLKYSKNYDKKTIEKLKELIW